MPIRAFFFDFSFYLFIEQSGKSLRQKIRRRLLKYCSKVPISPRIKTCAEGTRKLFILF
jgi:hypothetical protein